ncbi:Uu.00g121410.m01.CDS01 [Anthostomella pinea]|uniref:Uu.00g121410.m01.CDS01 n=1 Tax=Anthostomella pinea TaxID=933095 RepID=A0AAI8VBR2_9PEZI|nr:Uu.00g121410.m01.CDS01 [Anthostomella pinea]
MEGTAPKRRKTSPTSNVPTGANASSSSDSDGSVRRSARRRRPSFASPTKASLARANPDILERRDAARSQRSTSSNAPPAASEPGSAASNPGSDSNVVATQVEAEPEFGRPEDDGAGGRRTARQTSVNQPRSPVRRVEGGLASQPRRTPNKPSPRPLPPPSAEEEELIDPFKGRRLRRSPPPGVLPPVVPEEPDLPPTPTQKGLADPSSINTSPVGIHNTPSKRPRRSRVLAERMKSSPLKQPPLRPPEFLKESVEITNIARSEPRRQKKRRKSHPARNVPEIDPLADKKALRDALVAEVAQLERDLAFAARENNRLYDLQQSSRSSSNVPGPADEDLLDLLRCHALPPAKEAPPGPMEDWLKAALDPVSFLPFGQAKATLPLVFTAQRETEEAPPDSHHPISITAEEELPYLQVFTPLVFTSTVSTAPREDEESAGPLMQRHAISVSSSPPGLFAATIDMTVSTKTWSIARLSVPRLDPAAVGELGPFVEKVVQGGGGNSALTRNLSIVTWAMSGWVRLATRRARFWCAVERDLGTMDGVTKCAKAMRQGVRRRRPSRRPEVVDGDDDDELDDDESEADRKGGYSKADLLPQLARTSLDLELPSSNGDGNNEAPTARIQWRIEFDWTGEAQSKIGLLVGAPTRWHGNDEKRSLTSIPDMFDKLVQEIKDPMEAVKTVVALMVGEGKH